MFHFSKGYFLEWWIADLLPDVTVCASFLLELLHIGDGLLYLLQSFLPENT